VDISNRSNDSKRRDASNRVNACSSREVSNSKDTDNNMQGSSSRRDVGSEGARHKDSRYSRETLTSSRVPCDRRDATNSTC